MRLSQRGKVVLGSAAAVLACIGLLGIARLGFPLGSQIYTPHTPDPVVECGFATSCSAYNSLGFSLRLSIGTTSIGPDSTLVFHIDLENPTEKALNISWTHNWYLASLQSTLACGASYASFAFAVFRGDYGLDNLTSAKDVIPTLDVSCHAVPPPPEYFTIPPMSSPQSLDLSNHYNWILYSGNSSNLWSGNVELFVGALGSDKPGQYTMVAGDQWGDLVLLQFSVISNGSTT